MDENELKTLARYFSEVSCNIHTSECQKTPDKCTCGHNILKKIVERYIIEEDADSFLRRAESAMHTHDLFIISSSLLEATHFIRHLMKKNKELQDKIGDSVTTLPPSLHYLCCGKEMASVSVTDLFAPVTYKCQICNREIGVKFTYGEYLGLKNGQDS